MPQVWVIIVGYRNALEVASCITALRHQTFEDWGVIICENGGQSAFKNLEAALGHGAFFSEKVCALHIDAVLAIDDPSSKPCLLLHATENLGYAGAINACISTIRDKDWRFVWILNPDTEADPNALRELIVKAQSDHYGIVGSRLVYKDTALIQAYGGIWRQTTARGYSIGRSQPADHLVQESDIEGQMDYILGASMLVTRDYIQDVGEMDDRYFLYCEEVDWCLRRRSYQLGYAHASIILHTQGTTIGSKGSPQTRSKLAIYLDERNRLLIAKKFFPRRFLITLFVAGLCLGRYLKDGAWRNFWVALDGWWAGLRGLSGPPRNKYLERTPFD